MAAPTQDMPTVLVSSPTMTSQEAARVGLDVETSTREGGGPTGSTLPTQPTPSSVSGEDASAPTSPTAVASSASPTRKRAGESQRKGSADTGGTVTSNPVKHTGTGLTTISVKIRDSIHDLRDAVVRYFRSARTPREGVAVLEADGKDREEDKVSGCGLRNCIPSSAEVCNGSDGQWIRC